MTKHLTLLLFIGLVFLFGVVPIRTIGRTMCWSGL